MSTLGHITAINGNLITVKFTGDIRQSEDRLSQRHHRHANRERLPGDAPDIPARPNQ